MRKIHYKHIPRVEHLQSQHYFIYNCFFLRNNSNLFDKSVLNGNNGRKGDANTFFGYDNFFVHV